MNRMKVIVCVFAALVIGLTGCASKKAPAEPTPQPLEATQKTQVVEHRGTALGINTLPVWVETYINSGIAGLEKMNDYKGNYCFVGETTGNNLNAVQAWANGFNIPQDMAKTVSTRVQGLFTGAAVGSPESTYGTYFENVVKTTASATYSGARKMADWWVLVRTFDSKGKTPVKDEYRVFVLYTISHGQLDMQVQNMVKQAAGETKGATSEQMVAMDRVKALMTAEGFLSSEKTEKK